MQPRCRIYLSQTIRIGYQYPANGGGMMGNPRKTTANRNAINQPLMKAYFLSLYVSWLKQNAMMGEERGWRRKKEWNQKIDTQNSLSGFRRGKPIGACVCLVVALRRRGGGGKHNTGMIYSAMGIQDKLPRQPRLLIPQTGWSRHRRRAGE